MADIRCPFCKTPQDIDHDDGSYGYAEDVLFQETCCHCEKVFGYITKVSFYYESRIVECFLTGEHKFISKRIYPGIVRATCEYCGETRHSYEENPK